MERMESFPNIEAIKAILETGISNLNQELKVSSKDGITTLRIGKKVEAQGDTPQVVLDIDERTGNIELLEPGTIAVMAQTMEPAEALSWVRGIIEGRE